MKLFGVNLTSLEGDGPGLSLPWSWGQVARQLNGNQRTASAKRLLSPNVGLFLASGPGAQREAASASLGCNGIRLVSESRLALSPLPATAPNPGRSELQELMGGLRFTQENSRSRGRRKR